MRDAARLSQLIPDTHIGAKALSSSIGRTSAACIAGLYDSRSDATAEPHRKSAQVSRSRIWMPIQPVFRANPIRLRHTRVDSEIMRVAVAPHVRTSEAMHGTNEPTQQRGHERGEGC